MRHVFFEIAMGFILTHELDAMRCREWRIFPGLRRLSDEAGQAWFLALHVPLFAALLHWVWSAERANLEAMYALDAFFMIHVGLHVLLYRDERNEFRDPMSWALIVGAGVFGGLDLLSRGYA